MSTPQNARSREVPPLTSNSMGAADGPLFAVEARPFGNPENEECPLGAHRVAQLNLAKTSPYIANQQNERQNVSRPVENIFSRQRAKNESCARGMAELSEQALDALPQRVRILAVGLAQMSFELDANQEFDVRPGEQPFSLTAA